MILAPGPHTVAVVAQCAAVFGGTLSVEASGNDVDRNQGVLTVLALKQ